MISEIKRILTDKVAILTMIITALLLMNDATSRLVTNIKTDQADKLNIAVTRLYLPQLSKVIREEIVLAYNDYNVKVEPNTSKKIKGLSIAEQEKQNGQLMSLFIGDNQLILKAVIQNNKENKKTNTKSALINVINVKSNEEKIESFVHNTQVYGYLLTINENTKVTLTKQLENKEQKIILTMYKKGFK